MRAHGRYGRVVDRVLAGRIQGIKVGLACAIGTAGDHHGRLAILNPVYDLNCDA
jgi:hypothetical protein